MQEIAQLVSSNQEGGWKDGRLGVVYDILDEVLTDWPMESGLCATIRDIRNKIEDLDVELEGM